MVLGLAEAGVGGVMDTSVGYVVQVIGTLIQPVQTRQVSPMAETQNLHAYHWSILLQIPTRYIKPFTFGAPFKITFKFESIGSD